MLEDDELEAGGGGKTRPDGDETLVEAERTLALEHLHDAVSEAVVELGISRLVHKSGSNNIERRNSAGHEETS